LRRGLVTRIRGEGFTVLSEELLGHSPRSLARYGKAPRQGRAPSTATISRAVAVKGGAAVRQHHPSGNRRSLGRQRSGTDGRCAFTVDDGMRGSDRRHNFARQPWPRVTNAWWRALRARGISSESAPKSRPKPSPGRDCVAKNSVRGRIAQATQTPSNGHFWHLVILPARDNRFPRSQN